MSTLQSKSIRGTLAAALIVGTASLAMAQKASASGHQAMCRRTFR
jgi:hypothetical protein